MSGHGGHVAGRGQEAGLAIGNDFGHTAHVGSHHGNSAGHGFQRRQAEAFGLAGQQKQIALLKKRNQIAPLA